MPTRHKVAPPTCLCYTNYHHPNSPCPYNDPWLSTTMDTKGLLIKCSYNQFREIIFFVIIFNLWGVFILVIDFSPLQFSLWVLWISFNFIIAIIHLTETVNMTKKSFRVYESAFFFGTQAQGSWAKLLWFGELSLVHRN